MQDFHFYKIHVWKIKKNTCFCMKNTCKIKSTCAPQAKFLESWPKIHVFFFIFDIKIIHELHSDMKKNTCVIRSKPFFSPAAHMAYFSAINYIQLWRKNTCVIHSKPNFFVCGAQVVMLLFTIHIVYSVQFRSTDPIIQSVNLSQLTLNTDPQTNIWLAVWVFDKNTCEKTCCRIQEKYMSVAVFQQKYIFLYFKKSSKKYM